MKRKCAFASISSKPKKSYVGGLRWAEDLSEEIIMDFREVRCSLARMNAFVEVEWIMLKFMIRLSGIF